MLPSLLAEESKAHPPKTMRMALRVPVLEQDPPLDRSAFSAKLDGQPARIVRVQGQSDDLVLILVLDLSGEPTLVDAAREALTEMIPKLAKNHWLGVMKAQDVLGTLLEPTSDREKAISTIREYPATGKAGLLDTVEAVAAIGQRMMDRSGVRVAVLYLTDSNIYNYREDYTNPVINATDSRDLSRRFPDQLIREKLQKLSDQLVRLETPISILHLNYFSDPINQSYQQGLLQLAEESGGLGQFCRSRGEIAAAVERALDALAKHWSVAVELRKSKARLFTVDLLNGERDVPNRARFGAGK